MWENNAGKRREHGVIPRLTRRQLLKFAGAGAGAAALYRVSDWWTQPSASAASVGIRATRSEWTIREGLPESGVFETEPLWPDGPFNALDVSWLAHDETGVAVSVCLSDDGVSWTDWISLHRDTHAREEDGPRSFADPLLMRGKAFRVRVSVEPGTGLQELSFGTLDSAARTGLRSLQAVELIDGFIIPRAGWGADEALRHEGKDITKPVIWPPEYHDIEKIIIHHTATPNDPADTLASLRAVYYYHAVTRGWGDIGYNFVVDQEGNVYEGRFGGPNVVAGHALQYNRGSLGISMLGTFMTTPPSQDALDAIQRVITTRAGHVDVTAASDFVDLSGVPNLCGHGDVLPTSCPGDAFHELIPDLRGQIAGTEPIYLAPPVLVEAVAVDTCEIGPSVVYQGNMLQVRMWVSNPSISTIYSQGPEPGFVYDEGQDFASAGFPKVEGYYRFGIDFTGNTGTPNPYRWGFGAPLEPGEEREVVGYVRLSTRRTATWTASVLKEFVHYVVDHYYPYEVRTARPPVDRAAPSNDSGAAYFDETGHNVPRAFSRYWQANGGLQRFGYPLTEAFEEVSITDGRRYLTQYFERARFEYHPEYAGTKDEVLLGLLGSELLHVRGDESAFRTIAPFYSNSESVYFAETGHSLSHGFLRYWEANGGLPIFGYPISEEFDERSLTDGMVYTVQYFERNRFEWHPEYAGTDDEIQLGHLAREALIARGWLGSPSG